MSLRISLSWPQHAVSYLVLVFLLTTACVSSSKHKELQQNFDDLSAKQTQCESKVSEQANYVHELETRLGENTADKAKLEASLSETKKALEEMAKRKREADARIKEFADLVQKFKPLMDTGHLSVKIVDGRMVVSLSSDVLFSSGSAKLSKEGTQAIREVAGVLASIPNRQYQVEGHTDNVPIQTAQFPSNWELASARAMTVLNTMLDAGMTPERVSAASYGSYKPAKPNDTRENRAANRRIEIAIVPDLSSLPGFDQLNKISTHETAAGS